MKKEGKQAVAKITVVDVDKVETVSEDVVSEKVYDQPSSIVGFSAGLTRNMGNYNSIKVHVSLSIPCYVEEIDEVYSFAKEWVDERVNKLSDELDGSSDSEEEAL